MKTYTKYYAAALRKYVQGNTTKVGWEMSSHPPTASLIGSPHMRKENPENVLLDRCGTDQSVGIAKKMLMFG